MTEEDTKRIYITPAIERRWNRNLIRMEEYFTDGRVIIHGKKARREKGKKADYILYYKNQALAIVEAKSIEKSLHSGMQQAIEYAEILDIPFAYTSNGEAFVEHDMIDGYEKEISIDDFPSPAKLWNRYIEEKELTPKQEKQLSEPYYCSIGETKKPRYYQRIAINRAIEAVSKGKNRILIVMATGTGKTYTAFQIIYNLWHTKNKRKILYLADRNFLIDQTMQQDFKPFEKVMTKIKHKKPDSSYEIYLSLYQQLAGDENEEPFRQFSPDFFDLIVVDECHRGSAKEDSAWRKILEYFDKATQIGMTATPKETKNVSNSYYFGEPIYTYSLQDGIDDGFLAPYKVKRIGLNTDLEGYRPGKWKTDIYGNTVEDREYDNKDFDKKLIIDERTDMVATKVTEFLKVNNDRFAKTIVFCVDIEHAERMRIALVNKNADLVAEDSRYVMKITGDDAIGKKELDNFISEDSKYPVIVTTSELMTTGLDCKTCKLIVIDKNIESVTEFKQIIGRGTRLQPDYNKWYFTIMDFRGVTKLFAKDDFWALPIQVDEFEPNSKFTADEDGIKESSNDNNELEPIEEPIYSKKQRINGVDVHILSEKVEYYDAGGKLITESIIEYSKNNIKKEYPSYNDFIKIWNGDESNHRNIIDELINHGVLLDNLREQFESSGFDDFDLICHIGFNKDLISRAERVNNITKRDYLNQYEGLSKQVLLNLLEKYQNGDLKELTDTTILELPPLRDYGRTQIMKAFGGKIGYLSAVKAMQREIYKYN